jgi:hypothetical protein
MTKQTLEQQIVKVLSADPAPPLDQLLTLIAEVESAIIEADNAAEIARAAFFDPVQTPDIHVARDRMEATQHAGERLRTLLPRLEGRAREAEHAVARQNWQARYEAAAVQRDALAKELRDLYPQFAPRLADLFTRIAANDRELSALHGSRPAGCKGTLLGAELVARGLFSFTRDSPSLTRDLVLPDFVESCKALWPPRVVPAAVLVAETVATIHDGRRYSSAWPEMLKQENAKRVAEEQQRIEEQRRSDAEAKRDYERSLPR